MHKARFFHFLHKRAKSSFFGFGEFAQFFEAKTGFVHISFVIRKHFLCFWLNFPHFSKFFRLEKRSFSLHHATNAHKIRILH